MKDELDRERIETLTREISFANALGYATALVIAGSGDQTGEALQFFDRALLMSLETIRAEQVSEAEESPKEPAVDDKAAGSMGRN